MIKKGNKRVMITLTKEDLYIIDKLKNILNYSTTKVIKHALWYFDNTICNGGNGGKNCG